MITLFLHFLAAFGAVAIFMIGAALIALLDENDVFVGGLLKITGGIALMAFACTLLWWAVRPVFTDEPMTPVCPASIKVENP